MSPESKRALRTATRKAKRTFFDAAIQRASDTRKPWDVLAWTKARPPPRRISPIRTDAIPNPTMDQNFRILHHHFSTPLPQEASPNLNAYMTKLPTREWPNISNAEIRAILRKASANSAPGDDLINWTMLKTLLNTRDDFSTILATIFNHIMGQGIMPKTMKYALAVIIPKPGKKDYTIPKAWRPIALLSCLSKLLMGVIAQRMQQDARIHDILHPNQYGGIANRSSLDAALTLTQRAQNAKNHGLFTSVLAVDISQFFPSIRHDILLRILHMQGFSNILTSFLQSYLTQRSVTYKWGAASSDTLPFNHGVPQGCKISPVIASLFLAPALRHLDPLDPEEPFLCISFVDDTVIAVHSRNLDYNVTWLTRIFTRWKHTFRLFGLELEDPKTELFHTRAYETHEKGKPLYHEPLPSITLNSDGTQFTIKPSEEWRYLGYIFDPSLNFKPHVNRWLNKAYGTLRAGKMLGNSLRGLPPSDRRLLYITTVIPVLTYGFQLWYRPKSKGCKCLVKKLATVQLAAARWITGGFNTTPGGAMEMIAGIPPLHLRLERQYLKSSIRQSTGLDFGTGTQHYSTIPVTWTNPTLGSFKFLDNKGFHFPPHKTARKPPRTPALTTMLTANDSTFEPSPFTDSPLGLRMIDVYEDHIAYEKIPPRAANSANWPQQVKTILDPLLTQPHFIVLASPPPGRTHTPRGPFIFLHVGS